MNLLQTYQAEQALHDTHARINRELFERRQLMQALANASTPRRRFQPMRWLAKLTFVARFVRIPRYGAVGRTQHP